MIKINLYVIGTLKEKYLVDAFKEYEKRLSKYVKLTVIEKNEAKIQDKPENVVLKEEGDSLLKLINNNDHMILLDLHGEEMSSEDLSAYIGKLVDRGVSPIDFVIGGTLGVSEDLRKRSNKKLCLSKMTFTHQMTRVILLEQIYRSFKILNNESYHH